VFRARRAAGATNSTCAIDPVVCGGASQRLVNATIVRRPLRCGGLHRDYGTQDPQYPYLFLFAQVSCMYLVISITYGSGVDYRKRIGEFSREVS